MADAVRVKGLKELNQAFARADRHVKREWRNALKEAADPVRATATRLAEREIRPGRGWGEFRVGVQSHVAYVAPARRGTTRPAMRRPKFAAVLMGRAMQPALDLNKDRVKDRVNEMLDRMAHDWGYF